MTNQTNKNVTKVGFAKWSMLCLNDSLLQGSCSGYQLYIFVEIRPLR